MKEEQEAAVVIHDVDLDNPTEENRRVLELFGYVPGDSSVQEREPRYKSMDEMIRFNRQLRDGVWVDFPDVPGARVLLAHPKSALLVWSQVLREARQQEGVPEDEDETPIGVILKATALAAFGRSIKDWEIEVEGRPLEFNKLNFLMMWDLPEFQQFLTDRWNEFRTKPESLGTLSGKD